MAAGFFRGADKRNRTADLFITSESLYRLSYIGNNDKYYILFCLKCQVQFLDVKISLF